MRRMVTLGIVAFVLLSAILVVTFSGNVTGQPLIAASCHGNCLDRLASLAFCGVGQEEGQATATVLGSAKLSENPDTSICQIDVVITGGGNAHSFIDPSQAAVFSVRTGLIVFTVDQGLVRVFPSGEPGEDLSNLEQIDENEYQNKENAPFTLSPGASVSLDVTTGVEISYMNTPAEEPADMLIAVAPVPDVPEGTPEATPSS
jgi:hypothetical protein